MEEAKEHINLAIVGSRIFDDYEFAKKEILKIITENNFFIKKIISGGAVGADNVAEIFAKEHNIPTNIIKPNWKIGRHAGYLRNTDIVKKSDCIIALWDTKSKGTKDTINKAMDRGKRVFIINFNNNDK